MATVGVKGFIIHPSLSLKDSVLTDNLMKLSPLIDIAVIEQTVYITAGYIFTAEPITSRGWSCGRPMCRRRSDEITSLLANGATRL